MKIRYISKMVPLELTHGRIYAVLAIEKGWYRIEDDTGEDYLYPPDAFEVIEERLKKAQEESDKLTEWPDLDNYVD